MGDIFMWIILGLVAIVFMVLNIVIRNQHVWLGYISLAFTALTVCAFYQNAANFVAQEDFSALMILCLQCRKSYGYVRLFLL